MLVRLFSRRDTAERHVERATTTRHLHPPRKAHERSLQQLGLTPFHERRPYATNTPGRAVHQLEQLTELAQRPPKRSIKR
jgi:hypothetical protein